MHLFALNRGSVQTVFGSVGSAGEVDLCEVDLWGSLSWGSLSTGGDKLPQRSAGHKLPQRSAGHQRSAGQRNLPPYIKYATLNLSKSYFNSQRRSPHQVVFSTEIPCSQHYIERGLGMPDELHTRFLLCHHYRQLRRHVYGKKV